MIDPFKIIEPTVISFSGGRTSAYMLWKVLQSNNGLPSDAIVCFANTGKEEEATLKFVNDCEVNWNVPIHWLEYRSLKEFERVDYKTASRNGEPFEAIIKDRKMLPNVRARFCTEELKVRTIHRYLLSLGWTDRLNMVGIRADEGRRAAKMKSRGKGEEPIMPLYSANISKPQVLEFWNKNSFDLELPKSSGASNCDLCFLKGTKILTSLIQQKPSRVEWWAKQEAKINARFAKDRPTYAQMGKFNDEQSQLFVDETIPCFCGD